VVGHPGASDANRDQAAVIRDTVYLDGGYLYWQPGLADGTFAIPNRDGIYSLSMPSVMGRG
jgi:hypothetical protein